MNELYTNLKSLIWRNKYEKNPFTVVLRHSKIKNAFSLKIENKKLQFSNQKVN